MMYVYSVLTKRSLVVIVAIAVVLSGQRTHAQPGWVLSHQKISDTEGGFTATLDNGDFFGLSAASLGDLDGDGVGDLAVGAIFDDDGGTDRGAVWVLFLNPDGTVKTHQKISDTQGGFTGTLDNGDFFGNSVVSLGDLDGDGVGDLAVGAQEDDDGGVSRGAVWVLFLNPDGTVNSHQKISDTQGGFTGTLDNLDLFGSWLASIGDLDGDGVGDLAVGAPQDDDGGNNRGAVWVLFLNPDGTVKTHQKISDIQGGFTGTLDNGDVFGGPLASLGDLDGDSVGDLAVGAYGDDDGGNGRGAVWILFLNTGGTVKSHQKISDTQGGFTGTLDNLDLFGRSVASLGDLDGDSVGDLAVGANQDDDGGTGRGAVWILFLNTDGTVKSIQKISDTEGGFTGTLDNGDNFGVSLAALGDQDGDGVVDLAVGMAEDDDVGTNRGAVWILFLDGLSVDITPPEVICELVPIDVEEDEGLFRVQFSVTDDTDPDPLVFAFIVCVGIEVPVTDGELVVLELDDEACEVEEEDGLLEISSPAPTLEVTAEDESGNVATCSADPLLESEEEDDDDDDDDDSDDDD